MDLNGLCDAEDDETVPVKYSVESEWGLEVGPKYQGSTDGIALAHRV